MSNTSVVLLAGALFCVLMLLVQMSVLRSSIAGVREWCVACALGCVSLALHAWDGQWAPLAGAVHVAALLAVFAGFRRHFGMRVSQPALGAALLLLAVGLALLHYRQDGFAAGSVALAVFQGGCCLAIGHAVLRSRKNWRSRYPCYFTLALAGAAAFGQLARGVTRFGHAGDIAFMAQAPAWELVFLAADVFVLPLLAFGGLMQVHDALTDRAEQAASRDFLTGAWSRRAFFQIAEREMSRSQRNGAHLSLLLIDVDNFKHINDSLGHAAGDQVLIEVVLRAETVTRSIDYFSRIGGEEFAVLLPDTSRAAALAVAERLRAVIERKPGLGAAAYTVSIGVASLHGAESYHEVMRRADAALYAAKATGRNRVVCEPD